MAFLDKVEYSETRFFCTCTCGHDWAADYTMKTRFFENLKTGQVKPVNDYAPKGLKTFSSNVIQYCPKCHKQAKSARKLNAKVTTETCNEECRNAHTTTCRCSCGGANHGKGLVA